MSASSRGELALLRVAVAEAAAHAAGLAEPPAAVTVEAPRQAEHGDYATNAALVCAKQAGRNPRELAQEIVTHMRERFGDALTFAEVAGPGFINLRLADEWYGIALGNVLALGSDFGGQVVDQPESINVEFVSANPTGPMHVGHGRNAAYGDALCRTLEFAGHNVVREFYINDFGSQVDRFGETLRARAEGKEVPEGGYQGAYIDQLVAAIDDAGAITDRQLADRGVELVLAMIAKTLTAMRVDIGTWFSERSLHDDDRFEAAIGKLEAAGKTFEDEGALWLRTSDLGDDKDRVLRRSNGEYTYFATDIAYHADKFARGADRLIDVWGADHHGYIGRMRAAVQALGTDPERFEPVIMQLVNLTEGGERVQMSKRAGEFVAVDDLLDDIGVDALRFFLVQRSHDTTMDLDLALAREQSDKNPVFYVQYAHARICSILRRSGDVRPAGSHDATPYGELHASEKALVRKLLDFPGEILEAVERRSPHRLTIYSRDLAADFAAFYRDCQVVGSAAGEESFRLALCIATRDVLARSLDLLGVSAPEQM
ncbi:MAG: arginine--tRNA ligase [Thermoleophilaceae bacterium]|nr:arginine--tRNA ligase [Thermoleophilaceae bacterium]